MPAQCAVPVYQPINPQVNASQVRSSLTISNAFSVVRLICVMARH